MKIALTLFLFFTFYSCQNEMPTKSMNRLNEPDSTTGEKEIFMGLKLGMRDMDYHDKINTLINQKKLLVSGSRQYYAFPGITSEGKQTFAMLTPCITNGKLTSLKLSLCTKVDGGFVTMLKTDALVDVITIYREKYGKEVVLENPSAGATMIFDTGEHKIYLSYASIEGLDSQEVVGCSVVYSLKNLSINQRLLNTDCPVENNDI